MRARNRLRFNIDFLNRHANRGCRIEQALELKRAIETQQHKGAAVQIQCRAAIGQHRMRRAMPGARGGLIHRAIIGRRGRTVWHTDRRIRIPVAQHHPDVFPFGAGRLRHEAANLFAYRIGLATRLKYPAAIRCGHQLEIVIRRRIHIALTNRPALDVIACQQLGASPAVQGRFQLPPKIHRITQASVKAKPTGGRHRVRRIPREKHPPVAIALSHQPAAAPRLHMDDLEVDVIAPQTAPDPARCIKPFDLLTATKPKHGQPPARIAIHHREIAPGALRSDKNVPLGIAQRVLGAQARDAHKNGHRVIQRRAATHLDTKILAHPAACAIAGHQILRTERLLAATARITQGRRDALRILLVTHQLAVITQIHLRIATHGRGEIRVK